MPSFSSLPFRRCPRTRWKRSAQLGLTLVEIMISLGILALTSVGGVSAFLLLNRYAANSRSITAAKELCQERIEQAQTMVYVPTNNTPSVNGQTVNGAASGPFKILGNAYSDSNPNYDVNGKLTSLSTVTTSTEPVNVYLKQETGTNVIAGTRTTSIGLPTGLVDVSGVAGQLPIIQFTVTVAYTYRGSNYSYSMYTLRSAD